MNCPICGEFMNRIDPERYLYRCVYGCGRTWEMVEVDG